jgi:hypothetical protein
MYIKKGFVISRKFICIELVYILYIVHTWHLLTLQEKIEAIFMLFHYLIFFQVAKYQVTEINPGLPIVGQKFPPRFELYSEFFVATQNFYLLIPSYLAHI